MRASAAFRIAVLLILAAGTARAQSGEYLGHRGHGGRRERGSTDVDSTRTLAGPWQVWGHLGAGWLGSPSDVRSRYRAGMDAGLSGDRRLADRVALRARLDYHDLPSTRPNVVYVNGFAYSGNSEYGHGWSGSALGDAALRVWNRLWLEAGAGGAYFQSGFPAGQAYVDPSTGRQVALNGASGWGGAWGAGVRYEFQPTPRDRLLAELQLVSIARGSTTLQFWALRIGYRAF